MRSTAAAVIFANCLKDSVNFFYADGSLCSFLDQNVSKGEIWYTSIDKASSQGYIGLRLFPKYCLSRVNMIDKFGEKVADSIKYPLRVSASAYNTTSANFLFKLCRKSSMVLEELTLPKSNISYYVGPGIVLDMNLNPLIGFYISYEQAMKEAENLLKPKALRGVIYNYTNPAIKFTIFINHALYTNPEFLNLKKLYEKYIYPQVLISKLSVIITDKFPNVPSKIDSSGLNRRNWNNIAKLYASRKYITQLSDLDKCAYAEYDTPYSKVTCRTISAAKISSGPGIQVVPTNKP